MQMIVNRSLSLATMPTKRIADCFLALLVFFSSCTPFFTVMMTHGKKSIQPPSEYSYVVNLINKYFVRPDGTGISLDTAGHPPLDSLILQLDEFSEFVRTASRSRDTLVDLSRENRGLQRCIYLDSLKIGYVRLHSFSRDISVELQKCISGLETQGLSSLLIDLRGSPGGLLEEATQCAEMFLVKNAFVCEVRASPQAPTERFRTSSDGHVKFSCVIAVDESTAAGAELMAGALQQNGRATLVGAKTFGRGSIHRIFGISDTLQLMLTTGYIFLSSGESFHKIGLKPDHALDKVSSQNVNFPKDSKELAQAFRDTSDTVLHASLEILRQRSKP